MLLGVLGCALLGCGNPAIAKRHRVEGSVMIDGAPIEKALITFIPLPPTEGPKVSGLVSNGNFVVEQADGPYCGKYLVKIETVPREIEAIAARRSHAEVAGTHDKPRPTVAPQYNRDSRIEVEVRDGVGNHFEFQVKSVKNNESMR